VPAIGEEFLLIEEFYHTLCLSG